jgi:hypothetical protein
MLYLISRIRGKRKEMPIFTTGVPFHGSFRS